MLISKINLQTMFPDMEDAEINSRLVGYCSDQVIASLLHVFYFIIFCCLSVGSFKRGKGGSDWPGEAEVHRE